MLYIHHSNFAEIHQALIADKIREAPLSNPLADEVVLVQSPGMAQWLKLGLAENLGIAANIRFPLPSSFIWQLFTRVIEGMPEESAFNKESMGWALMHLLPRYLSAPEFAPLRGYLAEDHRQRKRYQLAMKVADIFDQYLVYRPQWILDWERGEPGTDGVAEHPWQPILWRALVAYNRERNSNGAHRANLQQRFIDALPTASELDLPERLFVFGVSALAPQYLEILHHLGQRCDVHIMQLNPCRHYWGDLQDSAHLRWQQVVESTGGDNPLLASMGKLGRDYQAQLHSLDPSLPVEHDERFVARPEDSLLGMLQRDLLDLNNRGELPPATPLPDNSHHKTPLQADDRSLELHSCHSPMREVEVLHDRLLALFDADPSLQPRDVLVMVPNIDNYSASIQSVFGSGTGNRTQDIPCSIADRGVQQENPLLVSFFQLLAVPGSRFEVTALLDILEVPQVMQRFELQQDEFDELRDWIRGSGIRWGLDPQQLQRAGLYPQHQNSWRFGLRRMLLGISRREREGSFAGIQPFDGIEGLGAQKLGKLIDYLEQLDQLQRSLATPATAPVWQQRCHDLLQAFYSDDSDTEFSFRVIRRALDQLVVRLRSVGFDEELSPEVFLEHLEGILQDDGGSHRFLAGQVNFCTLMPMRSIPFRVICLLGMNDGAYPRSLPPMGFDLMALKPRLGDRSRRDDDRYLFLEALLSAREKLYISYVGRSIRDNSDQVPSVLVTELLEYCQQGFVTRNALELPQSNSAKALLDSLQRQHSLQPFGVENFISDADATNHDVSYDQRWLSVARTLDEHHRAGVGQPQPPFCGEPLPIPEGEALSGNVIVELPAFNRLFENSARYFFNHRLRVFFDDVEAMEEDDEPFAEDYLLRYQACTELVEQQLQGDSTPGWEQKLRLSGALAHAGFGQAQMNGWVQRAQNLSEPLRELRCGPEHTKPLDLQLPSGRLVGRIGNLFAGDRLVLWRAGNLRDADSLRLWLQHLALNASGTPTQSCFVAIDNCAHLGAIDDPLWALEHLEKLMQLYLQGQQQPLDLPLKSAMAWVRAHDKEEDEEARWNRVAGAWDGDFNPGDSADDYWSRVFPSLGALRTSEFTSLSEQVLLPMLQQLEVKRSKAEKRS
ncbi:exodeoxyribonuclease V subunit gamma [Aestuariirhabdus sp. LZHN29]|uniref:exodeoxyribonuclease V subunit gamma n=1 Tax=Aestuariirhabdus sp. LZHN29 TaxID=3417462 RepID=UPI003CED4097